MHKLVPKVQRAMLAMQRRSWKQGTAAQALLELGDSETMLVLAKEAATLQHPDGRLAIIDETAVVTDLVANGEAVLTAARLTNDPLFQMAADRMAHYLLYDAPRLLNGVLSHLTTASQVWVDSMYMAPPFLAIAGFPEEAFSQIMGMQRYVWNPEMQLLRTLGMKMLRPLLTPLLSWYCSRVYRTPVSLFCR